METEAKKPIIEPLVESSADYTSVDIPPEVAEIGVNPVHNDGIQTTEAAKQASSQSYPVKPAGDAVVVAKKPHPDILRQVEFQIKIAEQGKKTTDPGRWRPVIELIAKGKKLLYQAA